MCIFKKSQNTKNLKKNYFYNLLYQIFLLIIPLITTPYISRALLPEGVGKYSFSFSLITYFTIFASLGFGYYAQREIAKKQNDNYQQSRVFWEIILCRMISVSISIIVNIILCIVNVYGDYNILMWILTINIINVAFDVSFYFQGNEQFKSILLRNFIIRVITIVSIFVFVKKPNDLWIYTLINSLSLLAASISMCFPLRKMLVKVQINELKPLKHLKGTLILFLPTIAVSIYTILDKTLIGVLITDTYKVLDDNGIEIIKKYSDLENAYYEQSEKIVKLVMTIITAIGIVMIPRNSNEIALGNYENVKNNIYKTSNFVLMIGIPMMLGLIITSDLFVPWFLGDGYDKCKLLLKILSPLIIIIGLSNVFGLQYLIPSGKDNKFTIALIIGSIINLILNLIFINLWWSIGAAVATIIAETAVTLSMSIMIRKEISVVKVLLRGWKYYVSGLIMYISLFFITKSFSSTILYTFISVLIGVIIYGLMLIILRDSVVWTIINKTFNKIKPKNKQ